MNRGEGLQTGELATPLLLSDAGSDNLSDAPTRLLTRVQPDSETSSTSTIESFPQNWFVFFLSFSL
jgi:hypothetical protein